MCNRAEFFKSGLKTIPSIEKDDAAVKYNPVEMRWELVTHPPTYRKSIEAIPRAEVKEFVSLTTSAHYFWQNFNRIKERGLSC